MELSKEQRIRYARNISVAPIGAEGQRRLLESSVFVLGAGALGSVVASYLVGAGVGRVIIADYDTIDISNLQRQIQYTEADAGRSKVLTLADRLRGLNSDVDVVAIEELVTPARAEALFAGNDFIIDASDNPDTKYMVDRVCHRLGLPYCIAGVLAMRGQVMTHVPGSTRYSDLFPESAGSGYTPCRIGGIIGPMAGMAGSIQALEAIKYLTGAGQLLTDRLLIIDGENMTFTTLPIG
ncbi:MAG: HesA/MoeB/ThiF family protein [Bacteroides sp.]|nr:HesA/MoeB/ThiF family protein [Bacteroides sp.]MCM1413933.1 HesA/MoeB/ThiF family protein [Bacteroides sp.]MCM1471640.1 HesA/MoeB/ThiF family protein [Bacteroides sp.]